MRATIDDLIKEKWLRARERGELVWVTREGKEIPIKDMSDEHLENAIRCATEIEKHNEIVVENSDILDY